MNDKQSWRLRAKQSPVSSCDFQVNWHVVKLGISVMWEERWGRRKRGIKNEEERDGNRNYYLEFFTMHPPLSGGLTGSRRRIGRAERHRGWDADGAGFNELFHPPLVPPLNRRFNQGFSTRNPFHKRSIPYALENS